MFKKALDGGTENRKQVKGKKKRERKLNRERQTVVACWACAVISTELIPLAQ